MKKLIAGLAMSVLSATLSAAPTVDFTGSGMQVQTSDTVRLRNVNVAGAGKFWADVRWNSSTGALEIINAGLEASSTLRRTTGSVTITINSAPDLDQVCRNEFGSQYKQADWTDIKAAIGTDPNMVASLVSSLGLNGTSKYFVRNSGAVFSNLGYAYFIEAYPNPGNIVEIVQAAVMLATDASNAFTVGQVVCLKYL